MTALSGWRRPAPQGLTEGELATLASQYPWPSSRLRQAVELLEAQGLTPLIVVDLLDRIAIAGFPDPVRAAGGLLDLGKLAARWAQGLTLDA